VLLASIVSIGCQSVTRTDQIAREILVEYMPEPPTLPVWPDVMWEYADGRYSLCEEDVDKVLDYLENKVPLYSFEMERYEEQVRMVLDGILAL